MTRTLGAATILGIALANGLVPRPAEAGETSDPEASAFFEARVRPLLEARCQECHGPEAKKGGLRLDSRASILEGGDSGPAIIPGRPEESALVLAIGYDDLVQMPPKGKLPDGEVAILTDWVARGAPWPAGDMRPDSTVPAPASPTFDLAERAHHWSFQPVRDPGPPDSADLSWARTSIDRFLMAGWDDLGLTPAQDADRRTLIRRASFDLLGLPPTPEDVEAFVADDAPGAFERLIDRLLASPHHGERWARHWLDLIRFAETSGHEFDYDIPGAFRYRDYVIRALNADLPFDRFVVEHLAGDLVDPPRRDPATGRNESIAATAALFLGEGSHSPVDVREDQVLRIDNQIDVISKAFLGLTVACARCHDHKFDAISAGDYYALAGYLKSSRFSEAFIDPPGPTADLIDALNGLKLQVEAAPAPSPTVGPLDGSSVLFEGFDADSFGDWSVSGPAFGDRPSRPGDWRLDPEGPVPVAAGQAHSGLVSDRLRGVLRSPTFRIAHEAIHYRASGRGGRIRLVIDGFDKIRAPIYGGLLLEIDAPRPRIYAQDVAMWIGHHAYIEIADGATVDFHGFGAKLAPGDGFVSVDEIRFADDLEPPQADAAGVEGLGEPARPIAVPPDLVARYRAIEATIPDPILVPAVADGTGQDEHIFLRGSYRTPGPIAPRRFLEAIDGPDQPAPGLGSGRLDLARRFVDPANPLTARVIVNRVWKHHFGEGLVRTPDDFGAMGEPPTHPGLLDHLAARFVRDGWSLKALHRSIMLSHAYQMQSSGDPESDRLDPSNKYLHRANVRRLEAEALRDAILAASGGFDPTLFGPSVPPHLTPFMGGRGRPSESGPLDGEGRRSIYIAVRRNFLTPMFLAFDFPAPASCIGRRNVSNVPAQALTLLNDPFVLEQSHRWAERLISDGKGQSPEGRLASAYLSAFGRPPTAEETREALAFLGNRDDAGAWADLCHVLLNVKEFLFVD